MKIQTPLATVTLVRGVVSLTATPLAHLALADIYHGEADGALRVAHPAHVR